MDKQREEMWQRLVLWHYAQLDELAAPEDGLRRMLNAMRLASGAMTGYKCFAEYQQILKLAFPEKEGKKKPRV